MTREARRQDWAILDLMPGSGRAQVEQAYRRRRRLYEQGSLSTYTLLTEEERHEMLMRIEQAYTRITGAGDDERDDRGGSGSGRSPTAPLDRTESAPSLQAAAQTAGRASTGPGPSTTAEPQAQPPDESSGVTTLSTAASRTIEGSGERAPAPEAPDEPEPDRVADPGAYMRYHRLLRGITLTEVAEETKIRAALLELLEAECFSKLPARVYVRGFVVQYARAIGLADADTIARDYLDRMQMADPTSA